MLDLSHLSLRSMICPFVCLIPCAAPPIRRVTSHTIPSPCPPLSRALFCTSRLHGSFGLPGLLPPPPPALPTRAPHPDPAPNFEGCGFRRRGPAARAPGPYPRS
jgi:hypothetical protein